MTSKKPSKPSHPTASATTTTRKKKQPMTASLRRKLSQAEVVSKKMKKVVQAPNVEAELTDEDDSLDVQSEHGSGDEGVHGSRDEGVHDSVEESKDNEDESSDSDGDSEDKEIETTKLPPSAGTSKKAVASTPVNTSLLLKSFETHIAYAIWNKQEERGPLKCISHTYKLNEWSVDDMPLQVAEKIKNSGLYTLAQHSYKHVDYVTISAFIERWHPETNSFHLPCGELTITLDDVLQILNIPVVGSCIYKEADERNSIELLVDYLGIPEKEAKEQLNDLNSVKFNFLLDTFEEKAKKEGASEIDYVVFARAYLLFLLGCTLFCDKSGTKVAVQYLKCLEDINHLNEYAWGQGALAFLYRQLGLASRNNVKQMAGYLTLLTAWIYDHFPMLPNAIPNKDYDDTMPRMCRWQPMKQSGDTTSAIIRLREQLDDLTVEDICWDPYRTARAQHPLPEVSFYNGVILCFDIAEPYYPDRVLRQFGIAQRIPKNPMAPSRCVRGLTANQYRVKFDNGYWYSENWKDHVLSSKILSPRVVNPWDCTAKYMPWFLSVSHPIVQNPEMRKSSSKKVENNEKLRIAAGKAVEKLKENLKASKQRTIDRCLSVEGEVIDLLEEALNEPEKREKRAKGKNDPKG